MRPSASPLRLRLAAFLGAVAVLLWLSLAPSEDLPPVGFWDKAEHALAYLVLTGLGLILFPGRSLGLAAGVLALGVAIEAAQAVMGFGRQGDWRDVAANSLGVAAALAIRAAVLRGRRN